MSKLISIILRNRRKWCHNCGKWVKYITKMGGDICSTCRTGVTKGP